MAISYGRTDIETPIHADMKETISHGIIVSNLAYLVGKELGLQEEVCYDLAVAGMLHDLGKVRLNFYMNEKVEDEILAVDETRYMRMHPSIGYAILAGEMLDKVYGQIVDDLKKAIPLMEENYVSVKKNRFSPIAAKALLARVYLYMQEWDLAIEQAENVIGSNSSLFDLRDEGENPVIYNDNPLSYMSEDNVPGIGYLSEKNTNVLFVNGINELYMILGGNTAQSVFYPSEDLYRAYSAGDVRKYYFMRRNTRSRIRYLKNRYYRVVTINFVDQLSSEYGYTRVMRTEEMYLILAEAYAHKPNGISTAVGYLNTLREMKFRVSDFETNGKLKPEDFSQEALLETVWKERRLEFCFEEQRWFDLRRTTRPSMTHQGLVADPVVLKENDLRYVLQIPQKELSVNPEIGANPR